MENKVWPRGKGIGPVVLATSDEMAEAKVVEKPATDEQQPTKPSVDRECFGVGVDLVKISTNQHKQSTW